MNILSVAELARQPWDTPVVGVVGVVQMVHPQMGRAGWSLQNGRLVDVAGSPVVEFMLSKHERYWDPEQVKGKRVEFHATQPDDLVWKAQKAKPNVNRGQPFAKLEVAASARIVFVDATTPTLPGLGEVPSRPPAATPFALPGNPRVTAPGAPRVEPPAEAINVADLRAQLRQMLGLLAVVERVVGEDEVIKPADRPSMTERLFTQACSAGLFRRVDPNSIALELDPAAASRLRPNLTRLAELAKGREDMLNLLLRGTGVIRMDATWQNLTEAEAGKVLEREDLLQVFAKAS